MVEVVLENVTKRFDNVVAVNNVNLRVRRGEFTVLLGPSGCGKTTTLRIIAGLERPDSGRVLFDDVDVTDVPANKRGVAMVFQSYAVWPHMKVYDNIALPLRIRGIREDEIRRRVREVAELLRIEHLLDRYPYQLSGGEKQRVAVARAIAVRPKVLLMDEPLSNLDALLRIQARAEIKKLQRKLGITTIYVTHDQTEAMVLADKIVVMNRGTIQQVGTPDEIYAKPANTFVAEFIGNPPMNLFKAKIKGSTLVLEDDIRIDISNLKISTDAIEREVIVGIRPEHIRLVEGSREGGGLRLRGLVELIENLGSEEIVHVRIGKTTLKVKYPGRLNVREGGTADIQINPEDLHLFDPEKGTRINP